MTRFAKVAALTLLVMMTACVSGKAPEDTYTSPTTGKTTLIQSDREMCTNSCNEDYSRCMDSQAAEQSLPGTTPGMFGASAQCSRELHKCLPSCSTR